MRHDEDDEEIEMEPQPTSARREHLHRRVSQLLPWYANGTLDAAERRTVEQHLAGCPACREELAACRELSRGIDELGEIAPSPHPVQLARLMARIDAVESAGDAARRGLPLLAAPRAFGRRMVAALAATPRPVRTLLAAQLAAIALLGAVLALFGPLPAAAPYRTLSEAPPPLAAGSAGTQLHVVFAEGATAASIQDLLAGVRGQIVAGPSPLGAYTVEVPSGRGADPLEIVLAHLRAQREVSFVTPVAGGERER